MLTVASHKGTRKTKESTRERETPEMQRKEPRTSPKREQPEIVKPWFDDDGKLSKEMTPHSDDEDEKRKKAKCDEQREDETPNTKKRIRGSRKQNGTQSQPQEGHKKGSSDPEKEPGNCGPIQPLRSEPHTRNEPENATVGHPESWNNPDKDQVENRHKGLDGHHSVSSVAVYFLDQRVFIPIC